MAQKYESRAIFTSPHESDIVVSSSRCRYNVWVSGDEVTLRGPGVDENSELPELEFDSAEELAIYIVLLFESGLWPS